MNNIFKRSIYIKRIERSLESIIVLEVILRLEIFIK